MIETLVPEKDQHKYKVVYSPAQKAQIPGGHTFDLLFTSPPFFNFEVYTQEQGQSVQDYTGFGSWYPSFGLCFGSIVSRCVCCDDGFV